ncbi:XdhC family protein [Streptomyces sp. NPDC051572]|uniref:XdhC family protein n=1 Tax=Streptomyces sp. NPDC051572 TaxID=3155802 RepID=UPI00344B8848
MSRRPPVRPCPIVQVGGSTPLPPRIVLAVDTDGNTVGSVSDGCVEEPSTNCADKH